MELFIEDIREDLTSDMRSIDADDSLIFADLRNNTPSLRGILDDYGNCWGSSIKEDSDFLYEIINSIGYFSKKYPKNIFRLDTDLTLENEDSIMTYWFHCGKMYNRETIFPDDDVFIYDLLK